jgi:hypothetical protein
MPKKKRQERRCDDNVYVFLAEPNQGNFSNSVKTQIYYDLLMFA